jgi:hypothetical protein
VVRNYDTPVDEGVLEDVVRTARVTKLEARTAQDTFANRIATDTRSGDPSESPYTRLDYTTGGAIAGYARSAADQRATIMPGICPGAPKSSPAPEIFASDLFLVS